MILLVEDEAAKRTGVNVMLLCEPLMLKSSTGGILTSEQSKQHAKQATFFLLVQMSCRRSITCCPVKTERSWSVKQKNILQFHPLTKTYSPLNPLDSSFVALT